MADDDFKPRKPDFNMYFSDENDNVDHKDRSRATGVWLNTSKNGRVYAQIKVPSVPIGSRAVMYPVEDAKETKEEWYLSDSGLFRTYLKVLTSRQLQNLKGWQEDRLSDNPTEDTVLDCTTKKRLIHLEERRRRDKQDD